MLLSKKHLLVHHTASKDGTRPMLMQIRAYRDGEETVTVATDGYTLSEVREKTPPAEEFPLLPGDIVATEIKECFVPAEVAKAISPMLPKKTSLPILSYALAQKDRLTTTDLERATTFTTREVEGKFPDYKELIPKPAEMRVSIDPDKVRQALDVLKGHRSITIEFGEKKISPVVLRGESDGTKTTVVIMPLRS